MDILNRRIKTTPNEDTWQYVQKAIEISPDRKDADYIALALKLKCPLWSNDKKLKDQEEVRVYSTKELIREFNL